MCRRSVLWILCCGSLFAGQACAEIIDGEEFRDPTVPVVDTSKIAIQEEDGGLLGLFNRATAPTYSVSFVRVSSTSPMAVINDKRVTIGDEIDGAVVKEIDRSGVTLLVDNAETRISLYSTSIKSPVVAR